MADGQTKDREPGPWSPLRRPVFRALWIASLVANTGTWMRDLGASWLMTSLTDRPFLIAMVQVATSLPIFLLAVPAGALADIVDRRRYLIGTYSWIVVVSLVLGLMTVTDTVDPWSLLGMTFLLGVGMALTLPAFASTLPELVARAEIQSAVTLNSISVNVSRAVGPAIAGIIVAWYGPWLVFVLNAVAFTGILVVVIRWRREPMDNPLPSERFIGALRSGLRYVRQAPAVQSVLVRGGTFFLFASPMLALAPLVARDQLGGGAKLYGALLAAMGAGAVFAALTMPAIRRYLNRERLVRLGVVVQAAATALIGYTHDPRVAILAMLIGGMAWISVLSSLSAAGQLALPSWVRARGLSILIMTYMGGLAAGSAVWGRVTELTDVRTAFLLAAGFAVLGMVATRRLPISGHEDEDLSPSGSLPEPEPVSPVAGDRGPVMITVEYQIDPTRARDFARVMREMRRIRLRNGAISWGLFTDTARLGRYLEYFIELSWLEHIRHHHRVTVAERKILDQAEAFHEGDGPPTVRHFIAQSLPKA